MKGVLLVTSPVLPLLVRKSLYSAQEEESDLEGEIGSFKFTAEMTQLQNVLLSFEEETVVLRTELQSTKKEIERLRAEQEKGW